MDGASLKIQATQAERRKSLRLFMLWDGGGEVIIEESKIKRGRI